MSAHPFCRFKTISNGNFRISGTQPTEIRGSRSQFRPAGGFHADPPGIGDRGAPARGREAGIHDRRRPGRVGARRVESDRLASHAVAASGGDGAGPGDRAGQGTEGEQHRRPVAGRGERGSTIGQGRRVERCRGGHSAPTAESAYKMSSLDR